MNRASANALPQRIIDFVLLWRKLKPGIEARLAEFRRTGTKGSDKDVFAELAFCIFTPQSSAHSCWNCIESLLSKDILFKGTKTQILARMNGVRFKYNKLKYLLLARHIFFSSGAVPITNFVRSFKSDAELREWLVKNIKGLGYKESTHFMRNTGRGRDMAILDRHILRNLLDFGVIKSIPDTLTPARYMDIENNMRRFSGRTGIPMDHLDLAFWFKSNGEIFK